MDVDSFLTLHSAVQTLKFKSFFTKLKEEAIYSKSEKALMIKKIEKLEKEIENRANLHSELTLSKKDLFSPKDFKCTNSICTFPLHSIAQNHQVGSGQSRCSISFRGVIMPVNHHNISKASAPQVFPDQP